MFLALFSFFFKVFSKQQCRNSSSLSWGLQEGNHTKGNPKDYPPEKLTWPWKIHHLKMYFLSTNRDFPMSCWSCGIRVSHPFIFHPTRGFSRGSLELHHAALHIPAGSTPRCALSWGTNLARDPLEVRGADGRWSLQEENLLQWEILRVSPGCVLQVEYLFTYIYSKNTTLHVCKHMQAINITKT